MKPMGKSRLQKILFHYLEETSPEKLERLMYERKKWMDQCGDILYYKPGHFLGKSFGGYSPETLEASITFGEVVWEFKVEARRYSGKDYYYVELEESRFVDDEKKQVFQGGVRYRSDFSLDDSGLRGKPSRELICESLARKERTSA